MKHVILAPVMLFSVTLPAYAGAYEDSVALYDVIAARAKVYSSVSKAKSAIAVSVMQNQMQVPLERARKEWVAKVGDTPEDYVAYMPCAEAANALYDMGQTFVSHMQGNGSMPSSEKEDIFKKNLTGCEMALSLPVSFNEPQFIRPWLKR